VIYANGDYLPQNFVKAAEWFRKAAEQGDMDAQKILDDWYRRIRD